MLRNIWGTANARPRVMKTPSRPAEERMSRPVLALRLLARSVSGGVVLCDVLRDGGEDAEIEEADVGAEIEDEDPCAVGLDGKVVDEIGGQDEGNDGADDHAAGVGCGVSCEGATDRPMARVRRC